LTAEYYVRTIATHLGIDWANLRLFNTYGPGQTFTPYVGVITIFVNRLKQGMPLIIFGDGQQRRDFVHVSDIVRGWLAALDAPAGVCGTFNIGTGRATSVNQLAAMLSGFMNVDLPSVYEAARSTELRCSVADISSAKNVLGYQPLETLETALPATIEAIIATKAEE